MTCCTNHGWNDPCHRCQQDKRHDIERSKRAFALGGLGMNIVGRVGAQLRKDGIPWKEGTRMHKPAKDTA